MSTTLGLISSKEMVVIHRRASMERAAEMMASIGTHHLPVVDEDRNLIGMLSDRDVQRAMQIDQPDWASGKTPQPTFDPNSRVQDHMSWPLITIDEDRSIVDAARQMIEKRISSLVVIRGATAIGIVTSEDLLRVLIGEHEGALHGLRANLTAAITNSPIGDIAQTLANAGI